MITIRYNSSEYRVDADIRIGHGGCAVVREKIFGRDVFRDTTISWSSIGSVDVDTAKLMKEALSLALTIAESFKTLFVWQVEYIDDEGREYTSSNLYAPTEEYIKEVFRNNQKLAVTKVNKIS